jgi:hypothetical protein
MIECLRESELIELICSGRWPEHCGAELRSHIEGCAVCSETVKVASALHSDFVNAASGARIPSAGVVWWRSELRMRREAVQSAERPLTIIHAFAGAAALGITVALLVQMSAWFSETFATLLDWLPAPAAILQQHLFLAAALAALIVVTPVALYWTFSGR